MRHAVAAIALVAAVLAAGCGGRHVQVVDPNTSIHLSGQWNDDDSKTVSSQMIESALKGSWVNDFKDRAGRIPKVRVAPVVNKSNEEIATQIFTNDIVRALINSGKARVVASRDEAEIQREERSDLQANSTQDSKPKSFQEEAPDFLLQGSIRVQHDREGSQQVKFYQVDLKLVDTTSNEVVWMDSTERKKVVSD
jgi:penicillin-binding protein activator